MSRLWVRNIVVTLGDTRILDDVTIEVSQGALVAILGPSGSGKTTLLRAIAGFTPVDTGTITIGDEVVSGAGQRVPPERRGVTIVPQEHGLFPHLDVASNIGYGVPRKQRSTRVDEMLELIGLSGFARRMPSQLSGGQQQRVALGRALAPRPGIVLLDEPFSGLDAALRESVREEVSALLRNTGTTAIFVTHDQEEALSIADRVAVLRNGRVAQYDAPTTLYMRPNDLDVATFVGDANTMAATVTGRRLSCVLGDFVSDAGTDDGPATAMLRPEDIAITFAGGVEATVVERVYYGHDAMVVVETAGGERLRARVQGSVPERGQAVSISARRTPLCYPCV